MSEPVIRIRELIPALPAKDIALGYKFLDKRDFESLQELVDSAEYKVKKSLNSANNPKPEYTSIDLEKLSSLKAEVMTYCLQLEIPEQEEFEDYGDTETWLEEEEYD